VKVPRQAPTNSQLVGFKLVDGRQRGRHLTNSGRTTDHLPVALGFSCPAHQVAAETRPIARLEEQIIA
jgi:hypothetical protein